MGFNQKPAPVPAPAPVISMNDLVKPLQQMQEPTGPDDQISLLAIGELLNKKKIKTISRIKPEQTSNIAKLYMFSQTFDDPFTKNLADTILQLQISINGLGRKELVNLVQKRTDMMMEQRAVTSKDIFR